MLPVPLVSFSMQDLQTITLATLISIIASQLRVRSCQSGHVDAQNETYLVVNHCTPRAGREECCIVGVIVPLQVTSGYRFFCDFFEIGDNRCRRFIILQYPIFVQAPLHSLVY